MAALRPVGNPDPRTQARLWGVIWRNFPERAAGTFTSTEWARYGQGQDARATSQQPTIRRQLGMVTISYDEKPGIQALATTTPDRPPVVGTHPSHLRDYEYVRLGTVSLLAGLDLHSGRVIETVSDTHNSSDFIAFLRKLDSAYPEHHQIRLVLDNHSAHTSKETRGYLQTMPQRFVFVFTPTHGSWLNLIENQFSKMTRTMLRGIRVASKQELIERIHQYFEEINAAPVVFRWKYKMDETIIV